MTDSTGGFEHEETEWMPSDLKKALNLDHMPVIFKDDETEFNIKQDCYKSKQVGLTCIAKEKGAVSFLVCITTEDKIYVIDMCFDEHSRFLTELLKLHGDDLQFYIYIGRIASNHLWKGYHIDIGCAYDLSTLDIFLSMRRYVSSENVDTYSVTSLERKQFPYRDRVALARHYLQVELSDSGLADKSVLSQRPFNCKATNFIRKMAATTRVVAIRIMEQIDKLTFLDSEHIYSFGPRASDEDFEVFDSLDCRSYQRMLNRLNTLKPDSQEPLQEP